ncbi:alpha/beta fold hydrolase [Chitinophaga sp. Cy-1792]|uniref:alpha/beta fold hydrolase n=1 Tax=Chitinophaga sp. Cy-1792 TaxID=2608339 RepID=UPI00142305FE|nr:alpha/beta fold hydrolase [Chitinophaga sp. Cy-1792]NIG55048.1 alpha/beta fold hydrolase [Chitinophaga sp. Cy-1792]
MTTAQQQYFSTEDGVKIAWRFDGEENKPVLVLSNSIATDYHMWDVQIPEFTRHFRVLRFDTRGNGASDAPAGDYSMSRFAGDVIELLDHLHLEKVDFLGLSMGGFIGQYLAIHYPERINKLILANTSSYLGPSTGFNNNINALREGAPIEGFAKTFIGNWFPKDMMATQPEVVDEFYQMASSITPQGLAGSFAAVRDGDLRKTAGLIQHPTLIIAGKDDTVTLPEHSEQMAATIAKSQLVILPAVHLSNVERKEEFNKLVIDFLS